MNCLHFIKISVENSNPHVFNYVYKHSIAGLIPRIIMDSLLLLLLAPRAVFYPILLCVKTYATTIPIRGDNALFVLLLLQMSFCDVTLQSLLILTSLVSCAWFILVFTKTWVAINVCQLSSRLRVLSGSSKCQVFVWPKALPITIHVLLSLVINIYLVFFLINNGKHIICT